MSVASDGQSRSGASALALVVFATNEKGACSKWQVETVGQDNAPARCIVALRHGRVAR